MNAVESATTEPDRDRQVDALMAQVKALPEIGVAPVEAFDPLAEAQLYQAIRDLTGWHWSALACRITGQPQGMYRKDPATRLEWNRILYAVFYAKLAGHSVTLMPSGVKWYEETFVKLSDSDRQEMWRQIVTGGPISGSLGKRLG